MPTVSIQGGQWAPGQDSAVQEELMQVCLGSTGEQRGCSLTDGGLSQPSSTCLALGHHSRLLPHGFHGLWFKDRLVGNGREKGRPARLGVTLLASCPGVTSRWLCPSTRWWLLLSCPLLPCSFTLVPAGLRAPLFLAPVRASEFLCTSHTL